MSSPADLRYPIGRFSRPDQVSAAQRTSLIDAVAAAPAALRRAVEGLTPAQLATPYRPGGWSVSQVVHHVPDSHLNAYIRFKLGLTEAEPAVRAYDQTRWAELPDSRETPIATSLDLLDALHLRWTTLLRSMSDADFARIIRHPESGPQRLDQMLALYAWHGRHHSAHITTLREREGWS